MLNFVKGDLIEMAKNGKFDIIMHGCNCQNIMGAGIALQIKNSFPQAYQADRDRNALGYYTRLGEYSKTFITELNLTVVNLYTQFYPGPHFEYSALRSSLGMFFEDHVFPEGYRIGLPKIGAGIGAGDWNIIQQIIEDSVPDRYNTTIVEYSK